jgi:signal transduction histidine kinase
MILFISPYQNAPDCATLIERATKDQVTTVDNIREALALLRSQDFTAVIADENLLESTAGSMESLIQRIGPAIPVFLDIACLRPERVAQYVSAAFRRRQCEYNISRELAVAELRSELKSDLTGLLLASEMALKLSGKSEKCAEQLAIVLEIANKMRVTLREKD